MLPPRGPFVRSHQSVTQFCFDGALSNSDRSPAPWWSPFALVAVLLVAWLMLAARYTP